jgi:LL-diaminopimelate aminotransferase
MAGWRVGAVVGQPAVLKALYTLKTNTDSGHFYPIMAAAVQAMTGDQTWLVERNEIYRQRRDAVLAGLEMVALEAFPPQASLYVWSKIPDGWNSFDFASALLEQAKVSITPGVVFGFAGEGYMRIALTAPQARIEQAMQRLVDFMKESEPR